MNATLKNGLSPAIAGSLAGGAYMAWNATRDQGRAKASSRQRAHRGHRDRRGHQPPGRLGRGAGGRRHLRQGRQTYWRGWTWPARPVRSEAVAAGTGPAWRGHGACPGGAAQSDLPPCRRWCPARKRAGCRPATPGIAPPTCRATALLGQQELDDDRSPQRGAQAAVTAAKAQVDAAAPHRSGPHPGHRRQGAGRRRAGQHRAH